MASPAVACSTANSSLLAGAPTPSNTRQTHAVVRSNARSLEGTCIFIHRLFAPPRTCRGLAGHLLYRGAPDVRERGTWGAKKGVKRARRPSFRDMGRTPLSQVRTWGENGGGDARSSRAGRDGKPGRTESGSRAGRRAGGAWEDQPIRTSRTIIRAKPRAKPTVAMLECSPWEASGTSSSTTT